MLVSWSYNYSSQRYLCQLELRKKNNKVIYKHKNYKALLLQTTLQMTNNMYTIINKKEELHGYHYAIVNSHIKDRLLTTLVMEDGEIIIVTADYCGTFINGANYFWYNGTRLSTFDTFIYGSHEYHVYDGLQNVAWHK